MKKNPPLLILSALSIIASSLSAEENAQRFQFGTGTAQPGFTTVSVGTTYAQGQGFGFEPGTRLRADEHFATGDQPFFFSVKAAEGNYRIRLTFGGDARESVTTVKAEARRLMLEAVRTVPGEVVTREIAVNVRTPRIDSDRSVRLKQREREQEWVSWDEKLTLEFNGQRPCVRSVEVIPDPSLPTVFLAGDSTVCDQALEPWNSWGQMLPRFFQPSVAVANHAESGESIRSSLGARRFEKIFRVMKPGDWLLVQFGHNDMKDRRPDALETYRNNLRDLIRQTRAQGATAVLVTSMERKSGVREPTLAGYPDAVREVAKEEGTALIDLNAMSVVLYRALGSDLDKAFQDGTHHNNYGSYLLAQCVAVGIQNAGLDLAEHLVDVVRDIEPKRPPSFDTFQVPPSPVRALAKPDGD